jgi:uncharacterized membrane protein
LIRLLALILTLFPVALRAEGFPALYDVAGVAMNDVLNVREDPNAGSPIIGSLAPHAKRVEVIRISGAWALVNTEDRSGYVSLRYLKRRSEPDWATLEAPLTCLGTEPFWSLQIDPGAAETRFMTPEDTEGQVAPIEVMWPGIPWSPAAAVALPDGLAVLAPADCSDGMSDRSYGIAVDIFLQLEGAVRLSGCCRLGQP